MRTALMCLVISHLQNGGADNATLHADELAGRAAEPAQLGLLREARRRRLNASRARVSPPEAAA
jgi:hypothetical protein